MLAKLESRKKLFSIVFFAASAGILIPIIAMANNDIIQVLAAVLLTSHFIIAVSYFFKGIATASMCAVYFLLLCIGIAVSVILSINITLPEFISNDVFTTIGIILFLFFAVFIPLPKIVKEFILKRLDNGEDVQEFTSLDIALKASGVKTKETEGTPYDELISYRGAIQWNDLPYSLANATPRMQKLRMTTGISLLALSFISLFIVNTFETIPIDSLLLNDWRFWAGILVAALITGTVIMLAGFIRGLIGAAGTVIGMGLILQAHDLIVRAREKSFALFIAIIIILALLICIGYWKFLMFISRKQRQNFIVFEENACVYAVDMFLKDCCPIIGFVNCLRIDIAFDDDAELEDFDTFNEILQEHCSNRKLIFAGAILNYEKQQYIVYIYCPSVKYIKQIIKYFRKTIKYPMEFTAQTDAKWDIYKSELAPSDAALIKISNLHMVSTLDDDFDFSIPHSIVMSAVFDDKDKALSCVESINQLNQQEYECAQFYDNSEYAEENNLIEKYFYEVNVQKSFMISEGWLNIETLKFNDLAKSAGGEYEFIRFGRLDEDVQNDNQKSD